MIILRHFEKGALEWCSCPFERPIQLDGSCRRNIECMTSWLAYLSLLPTHRLNFFLPFKYKSDIICEVTAVIISSIEEVSKCICATS